MKEKTMTQTLTLPDGVTVTSNALTCSRDLTLDEWKALGQTLRQFEGSIQWWLGDWWRNGEHSYGKRKALTTARKTFERGYSFGTLMNYGYVAGRTETSRRREALKYSHHYEVASLPPEEQDRWLDIAVREKLSVARLRAKKCVIPLKVRPMMRNVETISDGCWRQLKFLIALR
jgi:hypothetical protein